MAVEIAFGSREEESHGLTDLVEPSKIDVTAIHDVDGTGLEDQFVQDLDIVHFASRDNDRGRKIAAQIQQRVEFHCALVLAKLRPRKQRQAKIDRGGVQGVNRLTQFQGEWPVGVQLSSDANEDLCKIAVNPPRPRFVGVGERTAGNLASDASMIEFGLHYAQTRLDIAQTLPICQLREGHAEKLIETREPPSSMIALIAFDALIEFLAGKRVHQLRKNRSSFVHKPPLSVTKPGKYGRKDESI